MQVTINKESENFIQQKLNTGNYNDSSEVVKEALLLLKEEEEKKAKFKSAVKAGFDDYKADQLTDNLQKKFSII